MRKGGGKNKGSAFERLVCAIFSLWVTDGKHKDVFWRSAMSGGRATVHRFKGQTVRQSGDICTVAPEGHILTDHWFIECKFYRYLELDSFLLKGKGKLFSFWQKTVKEARSHGKLPMLIAKENRGPIFVITRIAFPSSKVMSHECNCYITLLDDLVKKRFADYTAFNPQVVGISHVSRTST